jgi:hypothetical protein
MGEMNCLAREETMEITVLVMLTLVFSDINHFEKQKLLKFGVIILQLESEE